MKRIAIIISGFSHGGAEYSIYNTLPEFDKDNSVVIYILQNLDKEIVIPSLKNVETRRLNATSLKDLASFYQLYKSLNDFDLIFSHLIWAQYWTGLFGIFNKSIRKKVIWVEHNVYINRTRVEWRVLGFLGRFVNKIIAVSDEVSLFLFEKTQLKSEIIYNAITVPNNGVRVNEANSKHINIAIYGRLVSQKNPILGVNSFLLLKEKLNLPLNLTLNVIGNGPLKNSLVSQYSGYPDIKFFEYQDRDSALNKLASCDIFLSSSIYEGFPLARMEALKLGLCVISTRTAGYNYLLRYYKSDLNMKAAGVYFVESNSKALMGAIQELLGEKYHSAIAKKRRVACVNDFSPSAVARKYLSI